MNKKSIHYAIKESKIVRFFANLNKNLLIYFFHSKTYEIFSKIVNFLKSFIAKNAENSLIINFCKKLSRNFNVKDLGFFIVLVTLFNTLAMIALRKEIDVFSICTRILFFIFGIATAFMRKR